METMEQEGGTNLGSQPAPIKKEFLVISEDKSAITATRAESPERKKQKIRGQNKNRRSNRNQTKDKHKLCISVAPRPPGEKDSKPECKLGSKCKYQHDLKEFWSEKPEDIEGECPFFCQRGFCPYGLACRFAKRHTHVENMEQIVDEAKFDKWNDGGASEEQNTRMGSLCKDLRLRKYDFSRSKKILQEVGPIIEDEVPIRTKSFANKPYLAPLTTVGNLPFRRVCVELGAEVTCGEMALATELLHSSQSEWALVRRHHSEKLFGIQLCGGHPDTMTHCAQVLAENAQVDFIDVNLGCPIDQICNKGAGCSLMGRVTRLEQILKGMKAVLRPHGIPLTLKLRTGIQEDKELAESLIGRLKEDGVEVDLFTLHGRSRDQRYTKLADWDSIRRCGSAAAPTPLFGCGDVLSFEDYYRHLEDEESQVSGVMIGRGALMKPWIFTEIQERRHWDIRSSERLDLLRRFTDYGLVHWGSDEMGVGRTRRFLLEWLSFLYRYIPVGLLERVPQVINQKPAPYFGRDDLETLMASPKGSDWVRITEMLLGSVPDQFQFVPKHKANAY